MFPILIVEDNNDIRAILARFLRSVGFEALTANNARDALAIATTQQLSVVILDVSLAPLEGMDMLQWLRASETTAHLPVIGVFGLDYCHEADVLARGYSAFLAKPFDFHQLLLHIRALTSGGQVRER